MSAKFLVIVLLGIWASPAVTQDEGSCPPGFTSFGESCYAYMQGKQTWPDAEQICAASRGHLVEIFTAEEQQFIQNMSKANGDHDVWLGAHDLVREGLWVWAWSGSDLQVTFWNHGQPNDGNNGNENCMELNDGSLMWNDEQCDHHKHFICQIRK